MKTTFRLSMLAAIIGFLTSLSGCKKDDPTPEDVPELITKATLTFTPTNGIGSPVVVTATDPDNSGAQDITVDGAINLSKNTPYTLTIQLVNGLYKSTDAGYDVSKEVEKEGLEHQFFFSWTDGLFSNPTGNGNIDNRNDPLNYGSSLDTSGRPIGLVTTWTTPAAASSVTNSFRVLLKHQPDIKSSTSTSSDGESDLDLTFQITVQ